MRFRRKLYSRGGSFETTIPKPLLFALDQAKKHEVIFEFDARQNKWLLSICEQGVEPAAHTTEHSAQNTFAAATQILSSDDAITPSEPLTLGETSPPDLTKGLQRNEASSATQDQSSKKTSKPAKGTSRKEKDTSASAGDFFLEDDA